MRLVMLDRDGVITVNRQGGIKTPAEIETLWLDYVLELAREARADPAREATTVVIGIHPL